MAHDDWRNDADFYGDPTVVTPMSLGAEAAGLLNSNTLYGYQPQASEEPWPEEGARVLSPEEFLSPRDMIYASGAQAGQPVGPEALSGQGAPGWVAAQPQAGIDPQQAAWEAHQRELAALEEEQRRQAAWEEQQRQQAALEEERRQQAAWEEQQRAQALAQQEYAQAKAQAQQQAAWEEQQQALALAQQQAAWEQQQAQQQALAQQQQQAAWEQQQAQQQALAQQQQQAAWEQQQAQQQALAQQQRVAWEEEQQRAHAPAQQEWAVVQQPIHHVPAEPPVVEPESAPVAAVLRNAWGEEIWQREAEPVAAPVAVDPYPTPSPFAAGEAPSVSVPVIAAGVASFASPPPLEDAATTPRLGRGVLGAALGAVAGALLWGGIGFVTGGWELKYGAIVIGALTGGGAMIMGRGRSKALGIVGAVFGLVGILAGKALFELLVQPSLTLAQHIAYHTTFIDLIFYAATVGTGFAVASKSRAGDRVLARLRRHLPFLPGAAAAATGPVNGPVASVAVAAAAPVNGPVAGVHAALPTGSPSLAAAALNGHLGFAGSLADVGRLAQAATPTPAAETGDVAAREVSVLRGAAGAAVGAVLGALLWGGVGFVTGGWEFKYGAIVIGLLTGGGAALLGRGRSKALGVMGAVAGLVGIVAGKGLFELLVQPGLSMAEHIAYHTTVIDLVFYAATLGTGYAVAASHRGTHLFRRARARLPFLPF